MSGRMAWQMVMCVCVCLNTDHRRLPLLLPLPCFPSLSLPFQALLIDQMIFTASVLRGHGATFSH